MLDLNQWLQTFDYFLDHYKKEEKKKKKKSEEEYKKRPTI